MVAKSPEDRYQSMTDVIGALEECQRTNSFPDTAVQAASAPGKAGGSSTRRDVTRSAAKAKPTVAAPLLSDGSAAEPTIIFADSASATDLELPTIVRKKAVPSRDRRKAAAAWWTDRRILIAAACTACLTIAVIVGVFRRGKTSADDESQFKTAASKSSSPAAQGPPAQDLLKTVDVGRDSIEGTWYRDGNDLISPVQPFGQIGLTGRFTDEYRLFVEVTRKSGFGPLVIGLPIGSSRCVATIDLQPMTHMARIEQVTPDPSKSRLATPTEGLVEGRKVVIVCEVHPPSVAVMMNGELVLKFDGDLATLKTPEYWQVNDPKQGFLGASMSEFHFHRISLESAVPSKGKSSPAR